MIRTLKVSNFKSFNRMEVELKNFNVLIGANASGKSNFIQIFKFLEDIVRHGLANAISIQGGIEYLRNIDIASKEDLSIEIGFEPELPWRIFRRRDIALRPRQFCYQFSLQFGKKGPGFQVAEDKATLKADALKIEATKKGRHGKEDIIGQGEIVFSRSDDRLKIILGFPAEVNIREEDLLPPFLREEKVPSRSLLVEGPLHYLYPLRYPETSLFDASIYDFDPRLPKKAVPITGKMELEEDGSNLAIVLKNIIEDRASKRKFTNLLSDLLPFVEGLEVEKFADKSLLFKLREKYFGSKYVPASLISDGTINITAIIVALYFTPNRLTIIEEPERNIHPYLLSRIISMVKDGARSKQIILTSHNPEIVKHAGVENLVLISRNAAGFSCVRRPSENSQVQKFLESEMGVEELYVQNLLDMQ